MQRAKSLFLVAALSIQLAAVALGQQGSYEQVADYSAATGVHNQRVDSRQNQTQSQGYYVWFRGNGLTRWHGSGPYNYYDACQVLKTYQQQGYQAYIGGVQG